MKLVGRLPSAVSKWNFRVRTFTESLDARQLFTCSRDFFYDSQGLPLSSFYGFSRPLDAKDRPLKLLLYAKPKKCLKHSKLRPNSW